MTAVIIDILLPAIALISLAVAFYFVLRAFGQRRRITRQTYGVGQVETRRAVKKDFLYAITVASVGALLLGAWGILLSTGAAEPAITNTPTPAVTKPAAVTATATQPVQETTPTVESTPTIKATETFPAPTATPTLTPTPEPLTATVSSGVGVWLRAVPNSEGEQLEWVLDGTQVILLPGYETGEQFEWQQVRTPSGNEGWVAVPFIQYSNQ
ncbi:MAG: SH3 domain-containing protein [Ardenticatenaceae bacterium]|nr:SH3 domain-containing protein [Anaerolineales bacterium]MCB8922572.1 SH3 domain-containing protein [Ardenticatenaceae bacterium]MCB8991240.1 SH3 domain-containing protein [Ardenticatenaceae bacterium]MCB9003719.1 SH3 domain-containing protein [Ardenticatenaceae bacterium]